jgi:hypothetical protein
VLRLLRVTRADDTVDDLEAQEAVRLPEHCDRVRLAGLDFGTFGH